VELKRGETIMTDASLHLPSAFLNEAFSKRSGVPLDHFELYYRGKRLEGEVVLASWGVGKDSTIEVKMRGRGGMSPGGGDGAGGSDGGGGIGAKVTDNANVAETNAAMEASAAAGSSSGQHLAGKEGESQPAVIELHGGLTLKLPQASIAYPPYTPCP